MRRGKVRWIGWFPLRYQAEQLLVWHFPDIESRAGRGKHRPILSNDIQVFGAERRISCHQSAVRELFPALEYRRVVFALVWLEHPIGDSECRDLAQLLHILPPYHDARRSRASSSILEDLLVSLSDRALKRREKLFADVVA